MIAPTTSHYVLLSSESALPNSVILKGKYAQFLMADGGIDSFVSILPDGYIKAFANIQEGGYCCLRTAASLGGYGENITGKSIRGTPSLIINNDEGENPGTIVSMRPNYSTQLVHVTVNGAPPISTRGILNFINDDANSKTIVQNDAFNNRTNITFEFSSLPAPHTATYILKTPNVKLPNAQALNSINSSLLKSNVTDGVISAAISGTDYQPYSGILQNISIIPPTPKKFLLGDGFTFQGSNLPSNEFNVVMSEDFSGDIYPTWAWPDGTVTSIAFTSDPDLPKHISVAGSPITTEGIINLDLPLIWPVLPGGYNVPTGIVVDTSGILHSDQPLDGQGLGFKTIATPASGSTYTVIMGDGVGTRYISYGGSTTNFIFNLQPQVYKAGDSYIMSVAGSSAALTLQLILYGMGSSVVYRSLAGTTNAVVSGSNALNLEIICIQGSVGDVVGNEIFTIRQWNGTGLAVA